MAKMTERELIQAIYSSLQTATDYSTTQLRDIRKDSWDRHLMRPRGDEVTGRSKVLDTSIADTTESLMAILSESWDCENICDFAPMMEGDEDQADAEARAINTLFWSHDNGYQELMVAAKNALMFRNGIIKVELDDTPEIEVRTFRDKAALAAVPEENLLDVEESERGITVTLEMPSQKLSFKAIEPAYFYVDPNLDTQDLQQAGFIAERCFYTRAELVGMGVSRRKVMELPESTDESVTDGVGQSNADITAKYIDGQNDKNPAGTADQQKVECYWVHMKVARKNNLQPARWRFLVAHRELLLEDTVTHWPYASGAAWIVPNRWSGLSVYDKLIQTEHWRTNILRQFNDNLNHANNQRLAADPAAVEFEDLIASAPGRPIRLKRADAVVQPIPVMDVTSNSIAALQYTDTLRSNQAGASLVMQSADAQSIKTISGISAELQLAPAEQMCAMISRNLSQTMLKGAFLIAHRVLREQWQGEITFYKAGEWQQTLPSEWLPRNRISLNLAMSPGEARRKAAALDWVINMNLQLISAGANGIAATWNTLHKAMTDRMRLTRLDDSEGYFVDPDSQAAQQAMQQAAQSQQAQMQAQMQAYEREQGREDFKAQEDSQKWREAQKFDYVELAQEAEIKEAELVTTGIAATRQGAERGGDESEPRRAGTG